MIIVRNLVFGGFIEQHGKSCQKKKKKMGSKKLFVNTVMLWNQSFNGSFREDCSLIPRGNTAKNLSDYKGAELQRKIMFNGWGLPLSNRCPDNERMGPMTWGLEKLNDWTSDSPLTLLAKKSHCFLHVVVVILLILPETVQWLQIKPLSQMITILFNTHHLIATRMITIISSQHNLRGVTSAQGRNHTCQRNCRD